MRFQTRVGLDALSSSADRRWGRRGMRYPASEKLEIIRLVEQSHLPVRRTLEKLGIQPARFYRWYDRLQTGDQKPWKIRHHGRPGSGTASPTQYANGLFNWPWPNPSYRPGSWRRPRKLQQA